MHAAGQDEQDAARAPEATTPVHSSTTTEVPARAGRRRGLGLWRVLLALMAVVLLGVLLASTTGGGESSGVCDETAGPVDVCDDGGQQPAK